MNATKGMPRGFVSPLRIVAIFTSLNCSEQSSLTSPFFFSSVAIFSSCFAIVQ